MKSILIIDDEALTLHLLETYLTILGVPVLTATNGAEGVEILEENVALIGMILLDLAMPVMSGYEFCIHVRNKLELALPVIAVTARIDIEAERQARAAGVTKVLHKPFNMNTLKQLLIDFPLEN